MNMSLTVKPTTFNIVSPLPHEAVGIYSPYIKGQKRPLSTVVFLCSSKIISTRLIRIKFFMVGCVRRLRSAVPLCGTVNLTHPTSNKFTVIRGGLKPNKGKIVMRNHNQKLTSHVSQLFFSLANKTESKWWQQYIDRRESSRVAPRQQGNDYKNKSILSLIGVGL